MNMLKNKDFWIGILIAGLLFSSVGYRSGDVRLDEIVVQGIDADGSFTVVTVTGGSFDCTWVNLDTTFTNTLDLTINGGSKKIRLYGGQSYNTASSGIPILVNSFVSDAVAGTPDIQYFCWGQ